MAYEDFCRYFTDVSFCKVYDDFEYSAESCQHQPGGFVLKRMILHGTGPITISVAQKDKRLLPRGTEYDYGNCRMIVMKADGKIPGCQWEYVNGIAGLSRREKHLEIQSLEAGEYLIFAELEPHSSTDQSKPVEFAITAYSAAGVSFKAAG